MIPTLLPYGAQPLALPADLVAEVRLPPSSRAARASTQALLATALRAPIGAPSLSDLVAGRGARLTIIISDATRDEPRELLLQAVREQLRQVPDADITIAVANGTHQPAPIGALGLSADTTRRYRIVNHDATDESQLFEFGRTHRGTRVRINRVAVEADLVVATGRIKPHYFAGFGAGAKAIFPGLGARDDI